MRQNKLAKTILTKRDLTKIRGFLPRNWRFVIAEKHTGLKLRQITAVFNLKTENLADNQAVWGTINEVLKAAGQDQLAQKVEKYLSVCGTLNNVIQN